MWAHSVTALGATVHYVSQGPLVPPRDPSDISFSVSHSGMIQLWIMVWHDLYLDLLMIGWVLCNENIHCEVALHQKEVFWKGPLSTRELTLLRIWLPCR